jgi:hypothetical protein
VERSDVFCKIDLTRSVLAKRVKKDKLLTHQAHSVLQRAMVAVLLVRVFSRLGSDRLTPTPVQSRAGVRVCAERVNNDGVQGVQFLLIVVAPATPEAASIIIVVQKH